MKNTLQQLKQILPLTSIATLMLVGCASTETGGQAATQTTAPTVATSSVKLSPAQTLATVNGQAIAKSAMPQGKNAPDSPEMESHMVEELIARELIAQEFINNDMAKDPLIAEQLANMNRMTYSQLASEKFIKSINTTDADLRKFYDQKSGEMISQQYKIRHILLDSQQAAEAAIAELNKGAKFDKLVKKLTKDAGTKDNGGDLGWVDPRAMGPNFGQALAKMKNGEVAAQPVQSQYGWHVIMREDAKTQPAPAFEAIKDKLAGAVRMEKFQEHIKALREKAVINMGSKPASGK